MKKLVVINLGSTSTKIAYFEDAKIVFSASLPHPAEEIQAFASNWDQYDYRKSAILGFMEQHGIVLTELEAFVSRGGHTEPVHSGVYRITPKMLEQSRSMKYGNHVSDLGVRLAYDLAPNKQNAFIVDSPCTDEYDPLSRYSGLPELPRKMQGHALNCRAMAIRCADEVLHKPLADCRLIVLHLGGGGSCRLFVDGRMVDCVRDDEWMFAPERFGGAAIQDVVTQCYSGKYTESEMMGFVRGKGGLVAHLGTSNAIEVEKRIEEGDSHAKLVYDGMLYSNVRAIGALAAAADGEIDRIILTGGLAHSKYVAAYITKKVSFIAPVEVMAGEFELEALAAGACRVLDGEEKAKDFSKLLEKA